MKLLTMRRWVLAIGLVAIISVVWGVQRSWGSLVRVGKPVQGGMAYQDGKKFLITLDCTGISDNHKVKCDFTPTGKSESIPWMYVTHKTHPKGGRATILFNAAFPKIEEKEVEIQFNTKAAKKEARRPVRLAPTSGTIIITISDPDSTNPVPSSPIAVDPVDLTPCP